MKTSIPLISPTRTERTIRASEVAQYVFCRRAWWLAAVQELPSANVQDLLAGERGHARHGRRVSLIRVANALAYLILMLAVVVVALWAWTSLAMP